MCGRFANHVADMREWSDILSDWPSSTAGLGYNIAPTQSVPVYKSDLLERMRWGLVPKWSREPTTKYATFNARIESVATKPAYRQAWRERRLCLVPALGYYEWRVENGRKQPYFICRAEGAPLVFGGIWERWQADGEELLSFSILTQPSTGPLTDLHDRMPVFIERAFAEEWMSGESGPDGLWQPAPPADIGFHAVSTQVSNARHQGEALIEPLTER